jgi:ribosomal protein S18 acetylase RimI-like enzyme
VTRLPLLTEALVRRLEGVGVDFTAAWLESLRDASPELGLEVVRFGAAVAAACPTRPELDFMNRVEGLWPEDEGRVREVAAFYRERGLRPWFEVVPADGFERLAARLSDAGAAQIGFHAMLYGAPELRPEPSGVQVRRVGLEEGGLFAEVLLDGHGAPASDRPAIPPWADSESRRLYLAEVGGEPAAAAVLTLEDGIGYLANASTRPDFRRRGCQAALLARRIADAAGAGCELVCAQTAFASASQRNVERAGLRVAYTKAVWRVGAR